VALATGGPLPSRRQMHQPSGFAQPDVNAAVLSHAAFTDPRMAADIRQDDGRIAGLCIGAYRISIAAFQADRPPWVRGTALSRIICVRLPARSAGWAGLRLGVTVTRSPAFVRL